MKRPKRISDRERGRIRGLLRHFHGLGYSLADCAHPLRLGRKPEHLLPLAIEAGVVFPDHVEVAARRRAKAP